MAPHVVIGIGPNDLEIPLVFFLSKEEADVFVEQFPKADKWPGSLAADFAEEQGEYSNEDGEPNELYKKLFKDGRYYSGCGGCYALEVREVVYGQPIVGWDLD